MRNSPDAWGSAAKWLHWTVAVLVGAQIPFGLAAVATRMSPVKLDLFVLHKSMGMLILLLTGLRLAWRLANPTPAPPVASARWERRAAGACHALLYSALVAMAISGWIINSSSNIPFRVFWQIPLPPIAAPDEAVAHAATLAHHGMFALLLALLVIHIGAAACHHLVQRDEVLIRMLPGARRQT
jgi:cytochrome b561